MRRPDAFHSDASWKLQCLLKTRDFKPETVEQVRQTYALSDRQLLTALVHATRQHLYSPAQAAPAKPAPAPAPPTPARTKSTTGPQHKCLYCQKLLSARDMEAHVQQAHRRVYQQKQLSQLSHKLGTQEEQDAQKRQAGYQKVASPVVPHPFRR